jgi:phosphoribosylformimino-5-aminoimidazole carboxamide ribotide isomerase
VILFPAIDLKAGACVRLLKGEMDSATVYNTDPGAQAAAFRDAGCAWIHVVDLDGAFAGRSVNGPAVESILSAGIPVQLGGGIRDMAGIESWLDRGIARVILGTIALRNPDLVISACRLFPGRVSVGIDARGGMVAAEGWAETSTVSALDLARRFEDCGVAGIIFTDIDRDGALVGVNVEATAALARSITTPVIASGGVSSSADLIALQAHAESGIAGVICGRSLYDGRLDLAEGLKILGSAARAGAPC